MRKTGKKWIALILTAICAVSVSGCGDASQTETKNNVEEATPKKQNTSSAENLFTRISVHDPTLVQDEDGTYYVFGSHLAAGKSKNLQTWTDIGGARRLFDIDKLDGKMQNIKAWMNLEGGDLGCWAADVIYNTTTKKYYFYACSSQFGSTDSVIWFATSDKIAGPYSEATPIVYSGFTNTTSGTWSYNNTNIKDLLADGTLKGVSSKWFTAAGQYNSSPGNMPNAIDPGMFYDKDGRMWMVYGSYFGGIYLLEIDVNTGIPKYPAEDDPANNVVAYFGKLIATSEGCDGKGEGPYVLYDPKTETYHLFVTYGDLAGNGGYNARVYSSKSPDGPYVDAAGNQATDKKNKGLKLMGNYQIDTTEAYVSPGHTSAIADRESGKLFHAYHTRFADGVGNNHQLRIHQMFVNEDGFTVVLPYEYKGETISETGYSKEEVVGEYGFINHGVSNTTSSSMANVYVTKEKSIQLNEDGTVTGSQEGTWEMKENSPYVTIKLRGAEFKGVFCRQSDESQERTERMVFTAAGDNNSCIWGVKK